MDQLFYSRAYKGEKSFIFYSIYTTYILAKYLPIKNITSKFDDQFNLNLGHCRDTTACIKGIMQCQVDIFPKEVCRYSLYSIFIHC